MRESPDNSAGKKILRSQISATSFDQRQLRLPPILQHQTANALKFAGIGGDDIWRSRILKRVQAMAELET